MSSVLGRIRNEKDDYRSKYIKLAANYNFNQYQTLRRIELYYNSKFESGEFDEDGFKKYFFNINRTPCDIATKEIDLDTKDIIVRPEDGDHFTAFFLARELKQWMKDNNFGKELNQYADNLPKYGSIVIKRVKNENFLVDLKNLIVVNQSAKSLDETSIIETHLYSRDELMDKGWEKKKIKEAIALYDQLEKPMIEVDERYGWVREDELKEGGDHDKLVYTLAIVAGAEEVETASDIDKVVEKGVILYHEEIDEHPYREHHWQRVPGRWLGLGFVEMLFDAQMRMNELAYYKAKGLTWSSLHLFQTDDETINRNLLTDAKNGDIIKTAIGRGISPVDVGDRNLSFYNLEESTWMNHTQSITFSTEVISGEALPSATARGMMISNENIKRYFDRKREDFGLWVRELIMDDIIPAFMKEKNKAHVFAYTGASKDRDKIEKRVLDARLTARFQSFMSENGRVPSPDEWNAIQLAEAEEISSRDTLSFDLPKDFYKNHKYRIDVVITKENEDTNSMIQGRQMILQLLGSNPAVVANPATRPLILELADLMGVKDLNLPNVPQLPNQGQPGGQQLQPGAPTAAPVAPAI